MPKLHVTKSGARQKRNRFWDFYGAFNLKSPKQRKKKNKDHRKHGITHANTPQTLDHYLSDVHADGTLTNSKPACTTNGIVSGEEPGSLITETAVTTMPPSDKVEEIVADKPPGVVDDRLMIAPPLLNTSLQSHRSRLLTENVNIAKQNGLSPINTFIAAANTHSEPPSSPNWTAGTRISMAHSSNHGQVTTPSILSPAGDAEDQKANDPTLPSAKNIQNSAAYGISLPTYSSGSFRFDMDSTLAQPFKITARSVRKPAYEKSVSNPTKRKITLSQPLANPKALLADLEKIKKFMRKQQQKIEVARVPDIRQLTSAANSTHFTPVLKSITIDTSTFYRLNHSTASNKDIKDVQSYIMQFENSTQSRNQAIKEELIENAVKDALISSTSDCFPSRSSTENLSHKDAAIQVMSSDFPQRNILDAPSEMLHGLYLMQKRGRMCDLKIKVPLFSERYKSSEKRFHIIRMHRNIFALHSKKYFGKTIDLTAIRTSIKSVQRTIGFMYMGCIEGIDSLGSNAIMSTYDAALAMGINRCVDYLEAQRPEIKTFLFLKNLKRNQISEKSDTVHGGFLPSNAELKTEPPSVSIDNFVP